MTSDSDLVGGKPDGRWAASAYLVREPSPGALNAPACGATLIAPNVAVTAAHCVTDEAASFSFGTGDLGSGPRVRVVERHFHPGFHPESQGPLDLTHKLRMFDVAYLLLERDVPNVTPAALPEEKPSVGCNVQAIGYRNAQRVSTPACVLLRAQLGRDPIFEVHPQESSALCVADGDEGSPVVDRSEGKNTLVGIYVGSITSGLTDCRSGTQFFNGYESAYGYRDFLREGIARGAKK